MYAVEVNHIRKSFGDIRAVEDFSFVAEKNRILALVGPDGSGKTSLFRSLCSLIDFDSGEIKIAGFNSPEEFDKIKPLLGYMPQNFSLYPDLTVEENLSFYAGLFGLSKELFAKRKSELYQFSGLGSFSNRRASALSGGMKQKLALSCNLIHDPEILFLDEPTTGVDPLSRRQFWDILKNLRESGSTIVVSTPYMDEVALADNVIFIYQGRKLAEGKPQELPQLFKGYVYNVDIYPSTEIMDQLNQIEGLNSLRFGSSIHLYTEEDKKIEHYSQKLESVGISSTVVNQINPNLEDTFIQLMEQ